VSTESLASSSQPDADADARCAKCGAALAPDQRYCLECGERTAPMRSVLLGGPQAPDPVGPATPPSPPGASPPGSSLPDGAGQRGSALTVIAGVGVLLLAMGVGVLIGRSGASRQTAPAQVISVAATPSTGTAAPSQTAEASFSSDWPSGTSGYTVQLQTLPKAGTSVSAVESAKAAATAKGAKAVGALESEEFSSLSAGSYVIYSGVHHTRSEAEKAFGALEKSFPAAKVIKVSNGGGGSSSSAAPAPSSHGGVGESESHPAPPSVLKNLKSAKGKSYEEKSKNLPDVVED